LTVGIDENKNLPDDIGFSAYPNPFNSQTVITFSLPAECDVEILIYDIGGRLVERLFEDVLDAGAHNISWNPRNLSSGIYFANLKTGDHVFTEKLVLLK
jgi:hypothetical protein